MAEHILLVVLALALLFVGAELLVRGSAGLAMRLGMSPLVIGLTVVAFGTSAPELVVSIEAALAAHGDIAVANVIGSNSFNIGVILGLAALIAPLRVHLQVLRLDAPVALVAATGLCVLLLDGHLGRAEGVLLVLCLVAYTALNVVLARRQSAGIPVDLPASPGAEGGSPWMKDIVLILVGLALLLGGARLLVSRATALADALGVSEAVIGLTIVAAGTSMPELATSLVAALRRQADIAIGNVIGSNVFNVLGILGAAALTAPLTVAGIAVLDYALMLLFSLLLIPMLYTGRMLQRLEGAVLLALYGAYLYLLWPR